MTTPPVPNAAVLLVILGRRVSAQIEATLAPLGLTQRHLSALGHVAGDPGVSYSELARRAGITVQSMKATLAHLEAMDAVEHSSEPGQGKRAELRVTTSGRRLLANARRRITRVEDELLRGLDDPGTLTRTLFELTAQTSTTKPDQRRGRGPGRA